MFTLRKLQIALAACGLCLATCGAQAQGYSGNSNGYGNPFGGTSGYFAGSRYFGNGFNYFDNNFWNNSGLYPVTLNYGAPPVAVGPNSQIAPIPDPNLPDELTGADITGNVPEAPNANVTTNRRRAATPGSSEALEAHREAGGSRLYIGWQGDPSAINRITFALLDRGRNVLRSRTVTHLPAESRLPLSRRASAYQVTIEYADGTTKTFVSPL